MLSTTERFLILIAALAVIAGVSFYIGQHVHIGCLFGNCVAVIK